MIECIRKWKVAAYQARQAKKKTKQKKIRTVIDDDVRRSSGKKGLLKKTKSSFVKDLTDTSKKGVKKMRYE